MGWQIKVVAVMRRWKRDDRNASCATAVKTSSGINSWWLLMQETLVAECDLGRDYEHCLELQKKVNDTEAVSDAF